MSYNLLDEFHEIEPLDTAAFLKVRETLTRIGLPARDKETGEPILWQSCHVLKRRGRYFICHFKQLFLLDGRTKVTEFTQEDADRLAFVVALLEEWGLIRSIYEVEKKHVDVVIIPHAEKSKWKLKAKYNIGSKRKQE